MRIHPDLSFRKTEKTVAFARTAAPVLSQPASTASPAGTELLPRQAVHGLKPLSMLRFGSQNYTYPAEKNIFNALKLRAEKDPNGIAFQVSRAFTPREKVWYDFKEGEPVTLTNAQLYDGAKRVAGSLRDHYGIQPGDSIAVIETNTPEFFKLFYAAQALNARLVPINIQALADEQSKTEKLVHMLKESNAKILFIGKTIEEGPRYAGLAKLKILNTLLKPGIKHFITGTRLSEKLPSLSEPGKIAERLRQTRTKLKDIELMAGKLPTGMKVLGSRDMDILSRLQPLADHEVIASPDPESDALMLFTSGTSGMPKGVPITHKSLVHNAEAVTSIAGEIGPNDRQLLVLPMFHIFGLSVFLAGMGRGAQSILVPDAAEALKEPQQKEGWAYEPAKILQAIRKDKISVLGVIPKILDVTLDAAVKDQTPLTSLKTLKYVISGGEKFPRALADKAKAIAPNMNIWEGYGMTEIGVVRINKSGQYGHVGQSTSPHIDTELRNQNEQGIGEIWINTPSRGRGYVGAPQESTDESFKPGGWLYTGDLGKLDAEGNLSIVGRNKEIIKRNGEILGPDEFDKLLMDHLPVNAALTLSYTAPGTDREKIVSFVLTDKGSTETEQSLKAKMQAAVDSGKMKPNYLPHYIIPMQREKFPNDFVSILGKNQHKNARAWLNEQLAAGTMRLGEKNVEVLNPAILT